MAIQIDKAAFAALLRRLRMAEKRQSDTLEATRKEIEAVEAMAGKA